MREYQCWTGGGSWEPPPERDDDEKKKDDDGDGGDDDGGGEARDDASGLILGRFDPPHRGHGYLFDVAGRWVSHLTIAVAGRDGDAVDLRRRVAWVREMAPRARVIRVDGDSLEAQIAALREELPVEATYLFSSERDLGAPLDGIATRHVVVDPDRLAVPISATMIRFDPLEHWAYLPEVVRPYAGCGSAAPRRPVRRPWRARWPGASAPAGCPSTLARPPRLAAAISARATSTTSPAVKSTPKTPPPVGLAGCCFATPIC
jgi:nicotinamide mononucleotide adenylyltransferase